MSSTEVPIGKLELRWPEVAVRLAAKIPGLHFDSGASADQTIDEFVIRQVLREVLIDSLSNNFVTFKEVSYPSGGSRIDLTVGPRGRRSIIAIELKGNASSVDGLKHDWGKMLELSEEYKLSIFAGMAPKNKYQYLEKELRELSYPLKNGFSAHKLVQQSFSFSISQSVGASSAALNEFIAFAWIWSIGVDSKSLPKIEYALFQV
ncbi:MAG: hypothetical protein O9331_01255 [Acidovorax sp.]|nr:hypothetical protein [Acidovorax sp.]